MASRKTIGGRSFPIPVRLSLSYSFIHSFIQQFLSAVIPHSAPPIISKGGKKGFSLSEKFRRFLCPFTFSVELPFPRFIPSRSSSSLVECPTLWCVQGIGLELLRTEG